MTFDFLARLQQELRLTLATAEETILAVAERVNRRIQLLRLHWNASQIQEEITEVHRDLGQALTTWLPATPSGQGRSPFTEPPEAAAIVGRASGQLHALKEQLLKTEARIQAIQSETVRDDLQQFLRDLESRGYGLRYVSVPNHGPLADGRLQGIMAVPEIYVVGVIRGPLVLKPDPHHLLRPGELLLLMGPPDVLTHCEAELLTPSSTTRYQGDDLVGRMSHT